jgi:hypothetical protein
VANHDYINMGYIGHMQGERKRTQQQEERDTYKDRLRPKMEPTKTQDGRLLSLVTPSNNILADKTVAIAPSHHPL